MCLGSSQKVRLCLLVTRVKIPPFPSIFSNLVPRAFQLPCLFENLKVIVENWVPSCVDVVKRYNIHNYLETLVTEV